MAYTTINKSTDYFNTLLYVADQQDNRTITGVGFQPDWVWLKDRDQAVNHQLFDSVRGATKQIHTNNTSAENTDTNSLKAFASDGFTLGTGWGNQTTGDKYVSWNWKANGTGSTNNDGSVASTVSANTTAGFSISKYTGTGSNATVGHGLGVAPAMIIIKKLNSATGSNWMVYHKSISGTGNGHIWLDLTNAKSTDTNSWNNTAPTSSVFSIGTRTENNNSGDTYIAYCFAEKTGYSKFGSYTGNGNSDGTFVYTGFKPSWLMIKRTNSTENWHIFDIKRNPYYPTSSSYGGMATRLISNLNNTTDLSQGGFRFLSNGLKMTTSWAGGNGSGDTFIFMCFGQSLVGSNNVPCTAR